MVRYGSAMRLSIVDDTFWGAGLRLPSWVGYQSRLGPYGSIDSPLPSDGSVRFIFAPEGRDLAPLNDEELALLIWFERNEPAVSKSVKDAVIDWCSPNNRTRLEEFDFGNDFPYVANESALMSLVGLHSINMHQLTSSKIPYLGYEFGCVWEEEHGLGVLVHGTRCVKVGFADTAILMWLAEEDERARNIL